MDLSNVKAILNGSEPISVAMNLVQRRVRSAGFQPKALPSYGPGRGDPVRVDHPVGPTSR